MNLELPPCQSCGNSPDIVEETKVSVITRCNYCGQCDEVVSS